MTIGLFVYKESYEAAKPNIYVRLGGLIIDKQYYELQMFTLNSDTDLSSNSGRYFRQVFIIGSSLESSRVLKSNELSGIINVCCHIWKNFDDM